VAAAAADGGDDSKFVTGAFEAYSDAEIVVVVSTDQVFIIMLSVLCAVAEAARQQWTFESRSRKSERVRERRSMKQDLRSGRHRRVPCK
jgi:hypothetical protein